MCRCNQWVYLMHGVNTRFGRSDGGLHLRSNDYWFAPRCVIRAPHPHRHRHALKNGRVLMGPPRRLIKPDSNFPNHAPPSALGLPDAWTWEPGEVLSVRLDGDPGERFRRPVDQGGGLVRVVGNSDSAQNCGLEQT